jgi:hypothetical protein
MTNSWAHPVNGDWNTASNWTVGVPTAGSTALITTSGTYTVTSSQYNSLGTLEMATRATLSIASNELDVTSGTGTGALAGTITIANGEVLGFGTDATSTTFKNTGTIELQNSGNFTTHLAISGRVTLTGNGKIDLLGRDAVIETANVPSATLINGNRISGTGYIADPDLTFVNAAGGIVDGDNSLGIYIDTKSFTNSGLLEATTGSGDLYIESNITQTATGKIKAATSGAAVQLSNALVTGGVISTVKGSSLGGGGSEIDTTTPIANAGTIETIQGNLLIFGSVNNTGGTLLAEDGILGIVGRVTGGHAIIEDTGTLGFQGRSSANVIFEPSATGMLVLVEPTKFTGTVAGLYRAPSASIELENIVFAHSPAVNFNATTHLLTVSDPVTGVIDKIKISGPAGTFTLSLGPSGTTLISDPPANLASEPHANPNLLVQAMASFGASGGVAVPITHIVGIVDIVHHHE